jgi:hypothetical protein
MRFTPISFSGEGGGVVGGSIGCSAMVMSGVQVLAVGPTIHRLPVQENTGLYAVPYGLRINL